MKPYSIIAKRAALFFSVIVVDRTAQAQTNFKTMVFAHTSPGLVMLMLTVACAMLAVSLFLLYRLKVIQAKHRMENENEPEQRFARYKKEVSSPQIETIPDHNKMHPANSSTRSALSAAPFLGLPSY
jgi:hypothetical protein